MIEQDGRLRSLEIAFEIADDEYAAAEWWYEREIRGSFSNSNELRREMAEIKHARNSALWRLRRARKEGAK